MGTKVISSHGKGLGLPQGKAVSICFSNAVSLCPSCVVSTLLSHKMVCTVVQITINYKRFLWLPA